MSALGELAAQVERDRFGRYLLPDPSTGRKIPYTRATTIAGSIKDTWALTRWQLRMAAVGLGQRPDLLAQVTSVLDPASDTGKRALDEACEAAKEHAGASAKATIGTAVHAFAEQVFTGARQVADVPEAHRADITALLARLDAAGLEVVECEQVVALHEQRIAGRFDGIVRDRDGDLFVLDLKTGSSVTLGMTEFAPQLAIYAHADAIFDLARGEYRPMPPVSRVAALVAHVPAGQGECTLHRVDIELGWGAVDLCLAVRGWRKRRDLASRWGKASGGGGSGTAAPPVPADEPIHVSAAMDEARSSWLRDRIKVLASDDRAKSYVATHWPEGTPTKGPWTGAAIDAIADVLADAEAKVGAPFHDGDPAGGRKVKPAVEPTAPVEHAPALRPLDDGATVTDLDRLTSRAGSLGDQQRDACRRWARDSATQGRPWAVSVAGTTERVVAIAEAAMACAGAFVCDADAGDGEDALVRAALQIVIGEDVQPSWWTGAVLGSLSIDEARSLSDLAARFASSDEDVMKQLGAVVAAA